MRIRSIVLSSELKFRNYVISNHQNITQIIIFEDILACTNFFYCFYNDGTIVCAKELVCKPFSFLRKIYSDVAVQTNLKALNYPDQKFTILLLPEEI